MTSPSKREVERKLEDLESDPEQDLEELWMQSLRRAHGELDDSVGEEEFQKKWDEAFQSHLDGA